MVERPPAGTIPDKPGSYQFKDTVGRVLYVGKAKSLRSRLSSYFGNPALLHPRTAQLVEEAASVEWISVSTELDALLLENELIKRHQPRFNVRLRDDKSYPWLALTMSDRWPRAAVMRGDRKKGVRYWGPFAQAHSIRETLDLLVRTFPVRTCSDSKFTRHERLGRPCLLMHIEKCSGPCVGEVSEQRYGELVSELCRFLDGDSDGVVSRLETEMRAAAASLEFERAARLRDRLAAVTSVLERRQVVLKRDEDVDIVGFHGDDLQWAVAVFLVRGGAVTGSTAMVVDRVEDTDDEAFAASILERLYDEPPMGIPPEVLVSREPADRGLLQAWLSSGRGSRVRIRTPERGPKRALMETVVGNATDELERNRLRRATDHNARARALNELQEVLGLPAAPLRIECFDMSHLQGSDYVGSMVVMEDAQPRRSEYRRFKVRTIEGNDDYAAMEEVLERRLTAYLEERQAPVGERGRFNYPPQLLLVDGGKGQLAVAQRVVARLGLGGEIPVAALAKRNEEVFVPGSPTPVALTRGSEALFLLQRVRDEAHRFAITYHRSLRAKRMTSSALDGIAGLGPVRAKRLVKELGGVRAVQRASLEELSGLSWLPDSVALAIHGQFSSPNDGAGSRGASADLVDIAGEEPEGRETRERSEAGGD